MTFIFPCTGNVIIPIDFHIFQRGRYTTNQMLWSIYLCAYLCLPVPFEGVNNRVLAKTTSASFHWLCFRRMLDEIPKRQSGWDARAALRPCTLQFKGIRISETSTVGQNHVSGYEMCFFSCWLLQVAENRAKALEKKRRAKRPWEHWWHLTSDDITRQI